MLIYISFKNRMLWDSIDLDDSHLVERLIDLGADPNWKNPSVTVRLYSLFLQLTSL